MTQLEADAAKLTDPAKKRWGFYVPFGDSEWISFAFEPLLWADGGSLLNANQTKATFDSPAGVQALTTWVNMVRTEKVAPNESFAEAGNFDGDPAFESNTVAMFISGQWEISAFQKDKLDYGVAEYPAGTKGRSTNIGIGVMALLQTTPAQDAAGLDFMKFLSSPAEAAYLTEQSGGLPDSAAVLSQPSMKSFIASSPSYNVFAADEQYGQVRPITPAYNAVSQALYTEINAALHGSVTPAQALAIAAKNADTALASNSGS
jgi:multiple sugar transport system substrate-binding protein